MTIKPPKGLRREKQRHISDHQFTDVYYNEFEFALSEKDKVNALNLSNQNIRNLDTRIKEFSFLKELNLSINPFCKLPDEITQLKQLEEIKLMQCPNLNLESVLENLSKLPALKILNLSNNVIEKIPDNIVLLKNLESLFLWNLKPHKNIVLSSFSSIFHIPKLKDLILIGHRIISLPDSICFA